MARTTVSRGKGKKAAPRRVKVAGSKTTKKRDAPKKPFTSSPTLELPKELLINIHRLMVKSRVLEERLIKIYKAG